jgi:hypothetical protein
MFFKAFEVLLAAGMIIACVAGFLWLMERSEKMAEEKRKRALFEALKDKSDRELIAIYRNRVEADKESRKLAETLLRVREVDPYAYDDFDPADFGRK